MASNATRSIPAKRETLLDSSHPAILQRWGNQWHPINEDHGCSNVTEMKEWCEERNRLLGKKIHTVSGLSLSTTQEVTEGFTKKELEVACRTLGLKNGLATQNEVTAEDRASELIGAMIAKGLMREHRGKVFLTAAGIEKVSEVHSIKWSKIQ